jgi:hypothetical protein
MRNFPRRNVRGSLRPTPAGHCPDLATLEPPFVDQRRCGSVKWMNAQNSSAIASSIETWITEVADTAWQFGECATFDGADADA